LTPRSRARTVALALVVAAVIAGAGWWGYRTYRAPPKPRYETATADRGEIVAKVTATGTLSALVTVQVGSQVSGRIQQLFADFNSPVEANEVIARIDPALFEATAGQARANLFAAQGNLTKARVQAEDAAKQFHRSETLAERKLIAQADLDTARTTADAARASVAAAEGSVEQAKASLHQAEVNLAYTTILSPIHGIVISRNVDVGQTVAASLQAPTLFVIAEDLKKMQVDTSVAEADIGKLSSAMEASFAVDAYPNERFTGSVRQIRNAPQTVQNVVTYDAVIDVDNADLRLKPGMTANVTFVYAERDDVLRVPNAALRFRPPASFGAPPGGGGAEGKGRRGGARDEGKGGGAGDATAAASAGSAAGRSRAVWVLEGGEPRRARIRTGLTDGTYTEVLEGDVKEGDELVTDAPPPRGAGATTGRPAMPGGRFPRL
jgi:HlyD family secretion protein